MSMDELLYTFPWTRYSKKIAAKVTSPLSCGFFTPEEASAREMRLAIGREGFVDDGNAVSLYLLVDQSDGVIADAKFQVFGQSALIAAAEAACDLLAGKHYDQARRIGSELIDKQLRDKIDQPAFPEETASHLNLVIDAIDDAVEKCLDLPMPHNYISPVPRDQEQKEGGGYPGWLSLSHEHKLAVIEEVLNVEVRPYIELDAGGIKILKLIDDKELIISYQGACTTCFSSIGATLSTIQQIVQAKVYSELIVVPNMDDLKL